MRVLLQRVRTASVETGGEQVAKIGPGLLLLVGFGEADRGDWQSKIGRAAEKLVNLRVFANDRGRLDHSVVDIQGDILAVPQFTLYGKSHKGRRPDFTDAMDPAVASPAFDAFRTALESALGKTVPAGVFGAEMQVTLVNDGPLTLQFEF